MRRHAVVVLAVFALSQSAFGGDLPVKALDAPAPYDWTGYYAGAHLDYQAGQSRWFGQNPLHLPVDCADSGCGECGIKVRSCPSEARYLLYGNTLKDCRSGTSPGLLILKKIVLVRWQRDRSLGSMMRDCIKAKGYRIETETK